MKNYNSILVSLLVFFLFSCSNNSKFQGRYVTFVSDYIRLDNTYKTWYMPNVTEYADLRVFSMSIYPVENHLGGVVNFKLANWEPAGRNFGIISTEYNLNLRNIHSNGDTLFFVMHDDFGFASDGYLIKKKSSNEFVLKKNLFGTNPFVEDNICFLSSSKEHFHYKTIGENSFDSLRNVYLQKQVTLKIKKQRPKKEIDFLLSKVIQIKKDN